MSGYNTVYDTTSTSTIIYHRGASIPYWCLCSIEFMRLPASATGVLGANGTVDSWSTRMHISICTLLYGLCNILVYNFTFNTISCLTMFYEFTKKLLLLFVEGYTFANWSTTWTPLSTSPCTWSPTQDHPEYVLRFLQILRKSLPFYHWSFLWGEFYARSCSLSI